MPEWRRLHVRLRSIGPEAPRLITPDWAKWIDWSDEEEDAPHAPTSEELADLFRPEAAD